MLTTAARTPSPTPNKKQRQQRQPRQPHQSQQSEPQQHPVTSSVVSCRVVCHVGTSRLVSFRHCVLFPLFLWSRIIVCSFLNGNFVNFNQPIIGNVLCRPFLPVSASSFLSVTPQSDSDSVFAIPAVDPTPFSSISRCITPPDTKSSWSSRKCRVLSNELLRPTDRYVKRSVRSKNRNF